MKKSQVFGKKLSIVGVLILFGSFMFAEDAAQGGLATVLGLGLGFFESGYMKAILMIALGGLGIGLISNKGEPGMVKKFLPWIAACVIILSLSSITNTIFPKVSGTQITPNADGIKF